MHGQTEVGYSPDGKKMVVKHASKVPDSMKRKHKDKQQDRSVFPTAQSAVSDHNKSSSSAASMASAGGVFAGQMNVDHDGDTSPMSDGDFFARTLSPEKPMPKSPVKPGIIPTINLEKAENRTGSASTAATDGQGESLE